MICIRCSTLFHNICVCPSCGWDVEDRIDAASAYPVGQVINGRYAILAPLGTGFLGATYKAADSKFGIDVVLRFIHPVYLPDSVFAERFVDGMRFLLQNNYPSTTKVLDVNTVDNRCYVASELLEGVPLRDLMSNRQMSGRVFSVDEAYPIIRQVSSFLIESDAGNHGALCPDNIWILPGALKILDVGLVENLPLGAVAVQISIKSKKRIYCAPEVVRGDGMDARSDVYSLGVLLGEMLTQVSYDGKIERFVNSEIQLSPQIEGILRRALQVDPEERYEDAEALLVALSKVAGLPAPLLHRPWSNSIDSSGSVASGQGDDSSEQTAQVAMEDVIRQHYEEVTAITRRPTPPGKVAAPSAKSSVPPIPHDRVAERFEALDEIPSLKATLPPPAPKDISPVAPKRPTRRISVMPSAPASAEQQIRAGAPIVQRADDRDFKTPIEGTQEIDLDALEVQDVSSIREVTQEIDIEALESEHSSSASAAADKLRSQAEDAQRRSTEELIRHASALDGVDPRFVRAAHTLESQKYGDSAMKAVQIINEHKDELNGIDPRFIRAAARLAEAKIGEVPSGTPDVPHNTEPDDEEWRDRIAAESTSNEDSVISFLAPAVTENPSEVQGFPRSRQRKGRNRPPSVPPKSPRR